MEAFLENLGETAAINGLEKLVIFDGGTRQQRTIRGTTISDTRPFILAPEDYLLLDGDEIKLRDQIFYVADVEHHEGMVTAFLEKDYGNTY